MNHHFRTDYHVPILFFTQLIGLAFGLEPKTLGIGTEIVSAQRALGRIGIEVPAPEPRQLPAGAPGREGADRSDRRACRCRDSTRTTDERRAAPPVRRHDRSTHRRRRRGSASTSATAAPTSPGPSTSPRSATGPRERLGPHGVVVARDYPFMCSSLGQELIEEDIRELGLNRVVVAACSPHMHEKTFRGACQRAGLNPYLCELVSIREQVSWVHTDKAAATAKAKAMVAGGVLRVREQVPLEPLARPDQRGDPGRRRRDRRHLGRARDRRRRVPGPPRRAPAVDRRPHGPVRQDVPDARLRRLHPDPEDGHGGIAPEHHAAHLERGDRRLRLRRQLHGQGAPPPALPRHRPVHRLRHLPGEVPGQGHRPDLRGRDRLPQGDLPAVPAGGSQVPGPRPGQLHLLRARDLQGLREALPAGRDPPRPAARGGHPPGRQHRPGHRLRDVRRAPRRAVRLRPAGQRLHQPRVRADEQRQRTDRRRRSSCATG